MRERKQSDRPLPVLKRIGTTLMVGEHHRCVRVLTLPAECHQRVLLHLWDEYFGPEAHNDVVVCWPWNPDHPLDPSQN